MSTFFGICLGCLTYRSIAWLKGTRPMRPERIEPTDVDLAAAPGNGPVLVEFGHPMCSDCQVWHKRLSEGTEAFVSVDVRERPDIAHKYGIALLPTVFEVNHRGWVLRQLAP